MAASALPEVELKAGTREFLEQTPKSLLIGDVWQSAASGETFSVINPANGHVVVEAALAGEVDVNLAVEAARDALRSGPWSEMSGVARGEILWKLADVIDAHADELAELETLDNGKPLRVARYGDLPYVSKHFRYYAGWASKIEGSTLPVDIPNHLVYTVREPVGVVGLIVPWNFPLLMAAWKLGPALAAGNTVLLKPAEETPLSALRLGELALEAGLPPGVLNILTGPGVPTGAAITAHPGVDKVAFTGSTQVGRKIMAAAAGSNLKKVSLELGGKSPNVIFADADLAAAVKGSTWAAFSTSGQECVAGTRLFIERPVFEEVLSSLAESAQNLKIDQGFAEKVHLGPIVSETQLERVLGYIDRGREAGVDFMTGGERMGGDHASGYFIEPTLFSHEDDSLELVQEEIFGPVVAATPFDEWDELVQRANTTRFGLAAGIWTRDISKAHRFARSVEAGTVWINAYGLFDAAAPFGGYKESGFGREFGKEGLELYTQLKTVWVRL